MRIQPPKTDKTSFTEDEFKEYILNHHVIHSGNAKINIVDFYKENRKEYSLSHMLRIFLPMWPLEYQGEVAIIFCELEDGTT